MINKPARPRGSLPRVYNKHIDGDVPWAVYIGRGSEWGNPYVIGKHGTREEVVAMHRRLVLSQPALVARIKEKLRGQDLLCFCEPLLCHGRLLVRIANSPDGETE